MERRPVCREMVFAAWVCIESQAGVSNYLPVKKNRRFLSFSRQAVPLFWRLDAEEGVTNVTSLSVKRSASLQRPVVARQRRYDSLWSPALS